MNEGQAKQTRNPTSCFTTGQSTLSFLIRPIAFGLATPLRASVTAFGTFLGFCAWNTLTKNLVSDAIAIYQQTEHKNLSLTPRSFLGQSGVSALYLQQRLEARVGRARS